MGSFVIDAGFAWLTATTTESALIRIEFRKASPRPATTALERQVERELREYGAGTRSQFDVVLSPRGTPFQLAVWRQLLAIPFGETRTYGDIAHALGRPGAARAVGSANHHNPIPIAIPCHRVVAAGGRLGGYGGGVALKRKLLALEAGARPALRDVERAATPARSIARAG